MEPFAIKKEAGFALLMATLVASVVLAVGTVIADLAIKQIQLSGTARESLNALYAADTGSECALFLDFRYNEPTATVFAPSTAVCNGQTLTLSAATEPDAASGETWKKFTLYLDDANHSGPCALVSVGKSAPETGQIRTRIRARGYNTCLEGAARRVERALQVEY